MNTTPTLAELLAPETLARIDNYALLARTAVEGFISGLHRSLYQGFGSEFFQYRNYAPGDDFKYVDWKVFARRDRFYTKLYQEETNMNCNLLLDASASLDYQGRRAPCAKLRYAAMIAACLAYLAARQGDNVGFYAFQEELTCAIPPGHRSGHLHRIFMELSRLQPAGRADFQKTGFYLTETLRRRGMLILISDFLEADTVLPQLLKRFRFSRQECVVFQVLDPDELDFPFAATTRFEDSETGRQLVTAPAQVREHYTAAMHEATEKIRLACLAEGVDYMLISTRDHLGHMLAAYLHRREGMLH